MLASVLPEHGPRYYNQPDDDNHGSAEAYTYVRPEIGKEPPHLLPPAPHAFTEALTPAAHTFTEGLPPAASYSAEVLSR